ncbi:MAG: hypothetical protein AAFR59_05495, partial [Bacteroidota bacterium]
KPVMKSPCNGFNGYFFDGLKGELSSTYYKLKILEDRRLIKPLTIKLFEVLLHHGRRGGMNLPIDRRDVS